MGEETQEDRTGRRARQRLSKGKMQHLGWGSCPAERPEFPDNVAPIGPCHRVEVQGEDGNPGVQAAQRHTNGQKLACDVRSRCFGMN